MRKNPCLLVYVGVASKASMSKVRIENVVQPAKPVSPIIGHLREQEPKIYVFSAHTIFTTWCVPFSNRISHFKVLASIGTMCCVHCLRQGWPSFLCKAPTFLPTRVGCAINVGQACPTFSVHAPKIFATQAFI